MPRTPRLHPAGPGFIANTDFGRFSHFLHRAQPPDEVDFWQPSPHGFGAIPPGAPSFFRVGAPHKAIAGFGFFARYERADSLGPVERSRIDERGTLGARLPS